MEQKKERLRRAVALQAGRVNRWALTVDSLAQQEQNALSSQADYKYLRQWAQYVQADPSANWNDKLQARQNVGNMGQSEFDAWLSAREISGDLALAVRQLDAEQNELRKLKNELESIRPDWPVRFGPVELNAPVSAMPATYPAGTAPASGGSPTKAAAARKSLGKADFYGDVPQPAPTTRPVP
jgi:hypothetical protein